MSNWFLKNEIGLTPKAAYEAQFLATLNDALRRATLRRELGESTERSSGADLHQLAAS